jgi:hypothetical protein
MVDTYTWRETGPYPKNAIFWKNAKFGKIRHFSPFCENPGFSRFLANSAEHGISILTKYLNEIFAIIGCHDTSS